MSIFDTFLKNVRIFFKLIFSKDILYHLTPFDIQNYLFAGVLNQKLFTNLNTILRRKWKIDSTSQ